MAVLRLGRGQLSGPWLDVIAHEFTHCVTETAMGANLYRDDYGAINEAMSDILGNLCEALCSGEGTTNCRPPSAANRASISFPVTPGPLGERQCAIAMPSMSA